MARSHKPVFPRLLPYRPFPTSIAASDAKCARTDVSPSRIMSKLTCDYIAGHSIQAINKRQVYLRSREELVLSSQRRRRRCASPRQSYASYNSLKLH